ncbi:unnamed protein product [Heligmosomoides polygyrus]|uniref:Uncharacterized protein n=1 Tax=Heligmosomoides polygyrus TaxID=6339 RepID=A0A183FMC1_HELPZ|nr:unnamed protein product [Heligmosomoides polygyrus]
MLFGMAEILCENKPRGRLNARLLLMIRAHQFETAQRYVYLTDEGLPELSNCFLAFRRRGSRIRVMKKRRRDDFDNEFTLSEEESTNGDDDINIAFID